MSTEHVAKLERKEIHGGVVLVTGGKGFLGSHLLDRMIKDGFSVVTYDNSSLSEEYPGWENVQTIQGDVLEAVKLADAIRHSDYVIHLAGVLGTSETLDDWRGTIRVNTRGALNVLNTLRDQEKPGVFITIGGITWPNPYAASKRSTERLIAYYQREFRMDVKIVRGLNIYGPRQKHEPVRKIVPDFILRALQGKPLEVFGDGEQVVDLVYVEDFVEVMRRAMDFQGRIDHIIEAGTGVGVTVNDLAQMIIDITNSTSKIVHVPMRPGEPEHSVSLGSIDTLQELGYVPSTPLEQGIKRTISWYENQFLSKS